MYSQIGGIVPKLGVKAGLLLKIISSFDALFSKFNCLPKPVNCLPVSFGRLFYRIFTPGVFKKLDYKKVRLKKGPNYIQKIPQSSPKW